MDKSRSETKASYADDLARFLLLLGLTFSIYSSTYSFTHLTIFTEYRLCARSYAGH